MGRRMEMQRSNMNKNKDTINELQETWAKYVGIVNKELMKHQELKEAINWHFECLSFILNRNTVFQNLDAQDEANAKYAGQYLKVLANI